MAKPIEVGIASETKAFKQGVDSGVIAPLEDAVDALDDLGKSKGAGALEDDLKDAQKATHKLRDETKETADAIEKNFRESYKSVKNSSTDATDGAAAGMDDVKSEAASAATETAASFDGSADSIVGMFQEVAANAFAGFGPAGMIAGLAAAAGIGLISAAMQGGGEDADVLKEKVSALTDELIETKQGGASLEYIVDRLKELATSVEEGDTNLADLADTADKAGSDFKDLAQAYAGNSDNLDKLVKKNKDYLKQLEDEAEAIDTTSSANDGAYASVIKKIDAQEKYNKYLDEAQTIAKDAAEAEANYAAAGGAAMEARAAAIETLQSGLDDAVAGYDEFKDAESGAMDPAAYIASIEARRVATEGFSGNVKMISEAYGLSVAESQAIIDQGVSFAPMLQSIIDSGLAPQFIDQMRQATGGAQEIIDGTPLTGTVTAEAETDAAAGDLDAVAAAEREAPVEAIASTTAAESKLNTFANTRRTASVTATLSTTAAETQMQNFLNKKRTAKIVATVVDRAGKPVD
jgi:cytochrome c551/c552